MPWTLPWLGRLKYRPGLCQHLRSTPVPRNDLQLIQACLAGRHDAWDELVDRFKRLVYSIPRRYGFSDADADDVFQNVFIILYRKLDTVRDHERLAGWLIRITHRECYRVGKQSGRYVQLDEMIHDVGEPSEHDAGLWERQQIVRQALEELGGRCQQLLTALFLATGTPNYEAMADQLGMKVGSIGPTRARCFEKMEKILRKMGLDPEPELEQASEPE